MSLIELNFNIDEVEVQEGFPVLPDGVYLFQCINSTIMPTRSGDGTKLRLRLKVVNPQEYAGVTHLHDVSLKQETAHFRTGIKATLLAFGVPFRGGVFDKDAFIGQTASGVVKQRLEEINGEQRVVNRIVAWEGVDVKSKK